MIVRRSKGVLVASLASCLLIASVPALAQSVPSWLNAPLLSATPFITAEYNAGRFLPMIGAVEAYRRGITGASVTIAIVDSGIDPVNPDFVGRISANSRNTIVGGVATNLGHTGVSTHGTEVAGVAAGARNGIGMHGVAYDSTILVLKTLTPRTQDVLDALNAAAASNALIINASFGPGEPPLGTTKVKIYDTLLPDPDRNERWFPAVLSAVRAGKIVVAAAGNSYGSIPLAADNPFGIGLYPYVRPTNANTGVYDDGGRNVDFSALDSAKGQIVTVAAVDINKQITPYSNRCGVTAAWCISAPGNVRSVEAGDNGATTAIITGTSFAAPAVAGALALYAQALPTFAPRDLVRLMFATTEDLGAPGLDEIYGQGLLRIDQTFNALGGLFNPVQADTTLARLAAWRQFGGVIEGRQQQLVGGGPAAAPLAFASMATAQGDMIFNQAGLPGAPATERNGAWATFLGASLRVGENTNTGGLHARTTQLAGGYDRLVAPDVTIGVAAGFSRMTMDEDQTLGANARVDSYQGALYATWAPGAWLFNGSLAAAYADIRTNRVQPGQVGVTSVAQGSTRGIDLAAQLSAGYRITVLDTTTIMPHAGLRFERLSRDAFTETGTPVLNLTVAEERFDAARSTLGVQATTLFPLGGLTLRSAVDVAWKHDFRDPVPVGSNAFFDSTIAIPGADIPRDALAIDAGLSAFRTEAFRVGVNYGVELRRNVTEQKLSGGLSLRW